MNYIVTKEMLGAKYKGQLWRENKELIISFLADCQATDGPLKALVIDDVTARLDKSFEAYIGVNYALYKQSVTAVYKSIFEFILRYVDASDEQVKRYQDERDSLLEEYTHQVATVAWNLKEFNRGS